MLSAESPFSFILFGGSGHLATIKIYPELFMLALKERLPEQYAFVGYARSEMDDAAFRKLVEDSIRTHVEEPNESKLKQFLSHVHYVQGQYDKKEDYDALAGRLQTLEKGWKNPTRLAYFSVPPTVFNDVAKNLCAAGIHQAGSAFRCIVEKPVGNDLPSFAEVKKHLLGCFQEDEIYLLDHYLGKEAVRNIYYLRYANPVLERIFKNTLIHHVEITAAEPAGIEGRSGYFEHVGTFRDMFQSHLLMIMSLLTMRLQESEEAFQQGRIHVLEQIYLPPATDLNDIVLQGQYAAGTVGKENVVGYRAEQGVPPDSRTNTYAALKLRTRSSRWEGVPFYLRSGKRMQRKETRISLLFQELHPVGEGGVPNRLDIILQGEAGLRLHLQTKLGGTEPAFRPLLMEDPLVCVGDCLPEHGLLLLEAIRGKRQWFMTFSEVETAWRLVDPVQAHILKSDTPLYMYEAGSPGPKEAEEWLRKERAEWVW